jgi:hypothetical protein
MGLFSETVPREWYDEMKAQRDAAIADRRVAEERYTSLVSQFVDLKRQEWNLSPQGFDISKLSPMSALGPKTQLAVEEFAAGDPELRARLINTATAEVMARRAQEMPEDEIDAEVATLIHEGDQG